MILHADLLQCATSLLLGADATIEVMGTPDGFEVEEHLQRARVAAADYFVAACRYAAKDEE